MRREPRLLKVVFIGDAGVGKTSIITEKCIGLFDPNTLPTLGADHESIDIHIDGQITQIQIWDTAGQEEFGALVPFYLRGSDVVCVVSSITDRESIVNQCSRWLKMLDSQPGTRDLIGVVNKIDLWNSEMDALEELQGKLKDFFPEVAFVSAKLNDGVDDLFDLIARHEPQKHVDVQMLDAVGREPGKKDCC
jgi:small GTP-binding protein